MRIGKFTLFSLLLLLPSVAAQESDILELIDTIIQPLRQDTQQLAQEVADLKKEVGGNRTKDKISIVLSMCGGVLFALVLFNLFQLRIIRRLNEAQGQMTKRRTILIMLVLLAVMLAVAVYVTFLTFAPTDFWAAPNNLTYG